VSVLGRVRPGAFQPPPKVESAFVGLRLRSPDQHGAEWAAFRTVVRAAFSQRRKTLRNALASVWGVEVAESALAELGWEPRTRAESLGLAEFAALHRALALFIKL
jgi:16S rRNA (adenine1518-N6/adenine1519-N6)-dimethyltransferase